MAVAMALHLSERFRTLEKLGLEYGPSFRAISSWSSSGDGFMACAGECTGNSENEKTEEGILLLYEDES